MNDNRNLRLSYESLCRESSVKGPRKREKQKNIHRIVLVIATAIGGLLAMKGCNAEGHGNVDPIVRDHYDVIDLSQGREEWLNSIYHMVHVRDYNPTQRDTEDQWYPFLQDEVFVQKPPVPEYDHTKREWRILFFDQDDGILREVRANRIRYSDIGHGNAWEMDYEECDETEIYGEYYGWANTRKLSKPK